MVIAALRLDIELEEIDMQNISPDFIKVNPQHTVPTLVDDGYAIWESRAVARYLANKYDRNNTLYPLNPEERGTVDSRLDFDLGTLCPSFAQYIQPQIFSNIPPGEAQIKKLKEALSTLNTFLEGQTYAVGSQLTIADLAFVASVSTIDAAGVDLKPYPHIIRWFELVKENAPGYKKYNEKGLAEFKRMVSNIRNVRTDMSRLRNGSSPSSAPNATSADNQSSDQASQAGPAMPNQHIFKMLYENRSSLRPCHGKLVDSEKHVPVHQSINVVKKRPYTQADLQKQFENYKKGIIEPKSSILEVKKKNKSKKQNETKHANCSCSSHASSNDSNLSEDIHISIVNRPKIGPMLVQDESETVVPASTPSTSRNRFFGSHKTKRTDIKDSGTGGSQSGLFGSSRSKRKLTLKNQ